MEIPINVDIEAELHHLWNEAQGKNKIRSALFNILFYASTEYQQQAYSQLINTLIEHFPSRVILIQLQQASPITTRVFAKNMNDCHSQAYCEVIEITIDQQHLDSLPSLILSTLIPDLPLYCVWGAPPFQDPTLLDHLLPYITKMIFDSESIHHLSEFGSFLLHLANTSEIEISDLHWSACSIWRELLHELFASRDQHLFLHAIDHVLITVNTSQEHPSMIEALFFQSWLAALLHWQYCAYQHSEKSFSLFYKTDHSIEVTLDAHRLDHDIPFNTIAAVGLSSSSLQGEYYFQREAPHQIRLSYSDATLCHIPTLYPIHNLEKKGPLLHELLSPSQPEDLIAMLTQLIHLPPL